MPPLVTAGGPSRLNIRCKEGLKKKVKVGRRANWKKKSKQAPLGFGAKGIGKTRKARQNKLDRRLLPFDMGHFAETEASMSMRRLGEYRVRAMLLVCHASRSSEYCPTLGKLLGACAFAMCISGVQGASSSSSIAVSPGR